MIFRATAALLLMPCLPVAAAPRVERVVADRAVMREGESASWRLRTDSTATIRAKLWDGRDRLVRTLFLGEGLPAGDHKLTWDLLDEGGRRAPDGYYLLTFELQDGEEAYIWDPSDRSGGNRLAASAVRYDSVAEEVRYTLPKPAIVRIHLGLRDGPLLRTLVDWVVRPHGGQAESWDGFDASGVQRFSSSRELDIAIWAYELPVNAVIVDRNEPPASADRRPIRPQFLDGGDRRELRSRTIPAEPDRLDHWWQKQGSRYNPVARLEPLAGIRRDDRGVILADGPVRMSFGVAPEDEDLLLQQRFEAMVYLDGRFLFEEEQGYLPFVWTLDPLKLTAGDHVVTIVAGTYGGHFATASLKVHRPTTPDPDTETEP